MRLYPCLYTSLCGSAHLPRKAQQRAREHTAITLGSGLRGAHACILLAVTTERRGWTLHRPSLQGLLSHLRWPPSSMWPRVGHRLRGQQSSARSLSFAPCWSLIWTQRQSSVVRLCSFTPKKLRLEVIFDSNPVPVFP